MSHERNVVGCKLHFVVDRHRGTAKRDCLRFIVVIIIYIINSSSFIILYLPRGAVYKHVN